MAHAVALSLWTARIAASAASKGPNGTNGDLPRVRVSLQQIRSTFGSRSRSGGPTQAATAALHGPELGSEFLSASCLIASRQKAWQEDDVAPLAGVS